MIAFLTSSPSGSYREEGRRVPCSLDDRNGFTDTLRQYWPARPARLLLMAADPDNFDMNDSIRDTFAQSLALTGLPVQGFYLCDHRDTSVITEMERCDVVILAGGHVPTQNAFFRETGLAERLQHFGGIVIGISAGSMNAAQTVYVQPELPGESAPEFPRFLPGLGLTDVMLIPHFQAIREDVLDGRRLIEEITFADSFGHAFCALEDGSYLLIEDGRTTLCGAAWCISNGWLEKINEDGEITRL